ncbi:hypothetical protein C8R45DRAFT_958227 [Mycena sanguinolenta]|nr:hypothetical protein C8R45DRAFT_958227 [Mycena sanguinolenta]
MALTSESLPALLKLDKNQFIQSYIQGQRAHAKTHAEEGRSLEASWETLSTPKKPSASGSYNVGFATPILTARVPRVVIDREGSKKENIPSKSADNNQMPPTFPADEKTQPKKPGNKPDKTLRPQKSAKKRAADSHSDEDQVARLAERREKKRVKRAIVQAKEPSEPDTVSSNDNNKKGAKGKAKAKKPKIPAGLALMHGFIATNVGKNRLTLKPPSNVGVFKKGKASFNTKIKSRPKGHQAKQFSESLFLNNGKRVTEQAPSAASSDSDSDSATTSAQEVLKPKPKKVIAQTSRTMIGQQASELSKVSASGKKPPRAESEIWDIESRASEKRKLLAQKRRSTDADSAIQMQGTVVMDARIPAWSNRIGEATGTAVKPTGHAEAELPDPINIPSSPSLRPSQSASQIGQLLVKRSHIAAASKYFAPAKPPREPTPAPEPVVKAVVKSFEPAVDPVSPLGHDRAPVESYKDLEPIFVVPNNFATSSRFVLPVRTRVFAEQFLSVQVSRSDSRDSHARASHLAGPPVTLENIEQCLPDMLPDDLGLDYDYDNTYHSLVTEEPFHGDIELSDYDNCPKSEAVWIANDANPVPDMDGPYNDEEFDKFSVQYAEIFDSPEYMDPVGDAGGYLEPDYGESGPYHVRFIPLGDELGTPQSNLEFDAWEEATTNSLYSPDCDYVLASSCSVAQDTGDDFLADAHNLDGPEFFALPVQASALGDDSADIVSECTESVSAYTPRFVQGRALLLGLPPHDFADRTFSAPPHISSAEVDVVKSLRGHWLPQRL